MRNVLVGKGPTKCRLKVLLTGWKKPTLSGAYAFVLKMIQLGSEQKVKRFVIYNAT
jgi:hypothetical protein